MNENVNNPKMSPLSSPRAGQGGLRGARFGGAQAGLVKTLLLIIVGVVILSVMGIDLQDSSITPLIKKNLLYLWEIAQNVWEKYLSGLFSALIGWIKSF